jgi:Uncharacterized protein conserved in bacteria
MLDLLVRDEINLPRAARISALVNVAGADSLYSSWAAKYTYWTARPQNIISQQCSTSSFFDPAFRPVRSTPRDPSYTSGLSTVSGVVSEILAFFFPMDAEDLRDEATLARASRLFDGTHWPHDNDTGHAVGLGIASLFIDRAQNDGANPVR